jgi:dihydrofolate reductase
MRKFIYQTLVSLDGYVSGPNDTLDWHIVTEDLHRVFNEQQQRFEGYVFGRRTYETMRYWDDPKLLEPDAEAIYRDFAAKWVTMPKLVVSNSLAEAGLNARIVRDDVAAQLKSLKQEPGGDMSIGGGVLAASIRGEGLIDEYDLFVHPVVLGGGRPLFPPAEGRLGLDLIETKTYPQGVVRLRYAAR